MAVTPAAITASPSPRLGIRRSPILLASLLAILVVSTAALAQEAEDDSGPGIFPVRAWSELAKGPNRFLFSLVDRAGELVAAPDVEVRLRFYDVAADPQVVAFEADSRFLWAIEGVRGLYAADITFPHAGRWGTRFDATFPDGRQETVRADYDVAETTSTPPIGGPAPAVDSPTAADVDGDLARISTDPEPMARLYEVSIAEAVQSGQPFVVAFVTPAFCQTATCGPTLEKVKAVAAAHPELRFIHVEPYVLEMRDGLLQPRLSEADQLQATPWTLAWGLLVEPYVVVVDGSGVVRAKFDGALTTEELEAAIAAL
jgi:hypothetical protein